MDSILLTKTKKRKVTEAPLVDRLKTLGFCDVENIMQCTLYPSDNVSACIKIRSAGELWLRITFKKSHEVVYIEDSSFAEYSIEVKIQRLENLQTNLKRLSLRKEEIFANFQNWSDYTKCNYTLEFFLIVPLLILF